MTGSPFLFDLTVLLAHLPSKLLLCRTMCNANASRVRKVGPGHHEEITVPEGKVCTTHFLPEALLKNFYEFG